LLAQAPVGFAVAETRRVFIHIGAPKTGTTYLQRALYAKREQLAGDGVLYPQLGHDAHHVAAWSLRPPSADGLDVTRFGGAWERLVDQVDAWSGSTTVVSTEMFAFFGPAMAAKVLTAFGDAEVHVIYTVRDLVRQVPAVWQEQVKNQKTQSYRSFVRDLLGLRTSQMSKHFWRAQDAPAVLERWSGDLESARVHVVIAPPVGAPSTLLWERFAGVIGVAGSDYDMAIPAANTSLGVAAAEALRRYNERHGAAMPLLRYRRVVQRPLMPALADGVADRSKLPLSAIQRRLLGRHAERIVAGLSEAGYDVVGSLDELVPSPPGRSWLDRRDRGPDDLSDAEVVDALLDVVHHMLEAQHEERRRARREGAAAQDQRGLEGDGSRGRTGRQR
jgi:hypothetical protein